MKFEWDPVKASANEGKHGITFDEASMVFGDSLSARGRDLAHSAGENRFITFGLSSYGCVLVVSHTDRGGTISIISARSAIRKEKRIYEENQHQKRRNAGRVLSG